MDLRKSTAVFAGALLSVGILPAATPGIGIAMSQGNILINSSQTAGNATLFDGSVLETVASSSQVRLNGGAQLRLASDSRGTVYTDHVNLEKGSARIAGYSANASGLSVRADGKSSATVSMRDQGIVEIAALSGSVHVFNAAGMNVANLVPGRALDLRPQDAGASAPSTLTGCAAKAGNNTLFTDETSNVTVQLRGNAVRAGRRVEINGTAVPNATPASPATQVINVTSVKNLSGPCKAGTAAAAAAGGAASGATGGAAAGAGAGISTTTAVVAGVAAAAAAGTGIGVAATSDSNPSVSSGRLGAFN